MNTVNNNITMHLKLKQIHVCVGSCNTLNDLSDKLCIRNKTENLNIHVFNIIIRKNKQKFSTKDISFECKCKFDGRK